MGKDWFKDNAPVDSAGSDWFTQNAPTDATSATPNPTSRRYDAPPNQYGWMGPAGMVTGGFFGGPVGAAFGAGVGTIWDQNLNRLHNTQYAPQTPMHGDLGVLGNTLLGGASEYLPPKVVGAVGKAVGPWMYKAALHVDPTLAEAFPGVDIPNEAWRAGAPELSQSGVRQAGRSIAGHAAEMRRLMDLAQSARYTDQPTIFSGVQQRVPTTVSREMTFDLPMTDPQAGAMPTVPRRFPQQGLEPISVAQNRMPSQTQEVGGPNQNVWTEWRPGMPVEQQVPRNVVPNPPQQVTHTVQVPGEKIVRGEAFGTQDRKIVTSNVRDLFDKSPQLKRLMSDVGDNLEGAADEGEVKRILDSWFNKNGGVTTLNKLATLARRAGSAGDWVHPSNAGGVAAQQATSPNAKLVGKELRQAIIRYIDNKAEAVGVTGLRAERGLTQKAIAVREAVRDAALRGTPHINASGLTEKAGIANRLLPPRIVGNIGRHLGGLNPPPPPMFGNPLLRGMPTGPAEMAGWTGVNAIRLAPWLLQQPANQDSTR